MKCGGVPRWFYVANMHGTWGALREQTARFTDVSAPLGFNYVIGEMISEDVQCYTKAATSRFRLDRE